MERTLLSELHAHLGKEVFVQGSILVRRDHGKLVFFDIHDRSGEVQAVILPSHEGVAESAAMVKEQWVVEMKGIVNKRPDKMVVASQANGDIELEITHLHVLGSARELPFDANAELNLDTLFDTRPLTLRRPRERAIFKVQHEIIRAYREFLTAEGFTEFMAPKIVGGDAEGGGNVFKLEYFKGQDAFLATSPQLYKQIMVGVFERVFAIGNVFRAEKHSTSRHLNEYTSLDIEMGFIKSHEDIMRLETKLMHHIIAHLKTTCADAFATLGATFPKAPETFPVMKLKEAQALIKEKTGRDTLDEPDLNPEDERWLCEYANEHLDSDYVFVTHYPISKRPFYTHEDKEDPGYTKSFDLLFRGVEITTGGQRIHVYDEYIEKLKAKKLDPALFEFYLQAFKYGMPPHGGWGMGLERLTQKFLGLSNAKEATLFPRDMNRIDTLLSS